MKAKERLWSAERLATFQEVIEKRAEWLYQRFYDEAGFCEWVGA